MRSAVVMLGVGAALAAACGSGSDVSAHAPDTEAPGLRRAHVSPGPHDVAILDLGELGEIRIELLPEVAPRTVAHFIERAERGLYDGTTFHRVIPGFMIQGGNPATRDDDPRNDRTTPGPTIPDEFSDYPHVRGTVSMANKGWPDSGGVQFFIVQADHRELDGHYAAFGRVVEGMEVVDAVTELEIDVYGRYGLRDRPYPVDARIHQVRIERARPRTEASAPDAAHRKRPEGARSEARPSGVEWPQATGGSAQRGAAERSRMG